MATATLNPVNGWDQRLLAVNEATFETVPNPAATQYIQAYSVDMGPLEQQDTRPIKDKTPGRDETLQFVSGRVKPMAFKLKTSCKTRAAVDAVPAEDPIYQSGGLIQTVNAGVNVTYSFSSQPTIKGLSLYSALGASPYEAEQGFGGIVEEINWTGGDHEVEADITGKFAGKYWLGQASATVADAVTTTINFDNAGDAYKVSPGWYQWAAEIIQVTAVNYAGNSMTVVRAALGSTGAAHTAINIVPYLPTISQPTTTPISEANLSISIDGQTIRCMKFNVNLKTGLSHLPGESGSIRVQGAKAVRFGIKAGVELVLTDDAERLIGKMNQRKAVAVLITAGTGVGGQIQFSLPTCILEPFQVPSPDKDISMAKLAFKVRGNAGNDSMTITLT